MQNEQQEAQQFSSFVFLLLKNTFSICSNDKMGY